VSVACYVSSAQTVSVDLLGRVYLPLCNGSVAVFRDYDLALIQLLNLTGVFLPRTVTPSTHNSVYVIIEQGEENTVVGEYSMHTGELLQLIAPVNQSYMTDMIVDVTDHSIWVAAQTVIHHFRADGTLISAWSATQYGSDAFWAVAIDYTRHSVVVSYGISLLWLDAVSGGLVLQYDITPAPRDQADSVNVSPDGSTVYATLSFDNTVLELHVAGHVVGSNSRNDTDRAARRLRDNRPRVEHVARVA